METKICCENQKRFDNGKCVCDDELDILQAFHVQIFANITPKQRFVFNGLQKAMFQALFPLSKVMNGLTIFQNPYVTKRHSKQFLWLVNLNYHNLSTAQKVSRQLASKNTKYTKNNVGYGIYFFLHSLYIGSKNQVVNVIRKQLSLKRH